MEKEASEKLKRYAQNRAKGMTKKRAALEAGYAPSVANAVKPNIEDQKAFKDLAAKYLLEDKKVMGELNKNITQDKDKGAKNQAIRIWKSWKYPDEDQGMDTGEVKILIKKDQ